MRASIRSFTLLALILGVCAVVLLPATTQAQSVDPSVRPGGPETGATDTDQPLVLTIRKAVQTALQRNLDLRGAQLDIENANAQVKGAWGNLYPSLNLTGSYTRNVVTANPFAGSDALSLLGGLFLFSMLMWVPLSFPEGSPDAAIAPVNISIFILAGLYGLAAWVWGTDTRELPSYVPEYIKELAMEERIKQELDIAREVQQSFLPKVTPQLSDLDIAALCEPAYETGGDYYDVIKLDENRIAVTIGDVSGKGIQAAFYMTLVKGILHSLCHEVPNPSELLGKVNRLFYKNAPRGTFISLIYGIIDVRQRTFTFARAGHNPILHWSPNNSLHEHQPCGMGLGLDEGELFDQYIEECTIELKKDDVFVLYTDGVVEALNPMREPYGMERLGSLVTNYATYSAREQLQFLNKDVSRFIGRASQHDDLTLLVIKMNQ
mgnify:CR=1 FL=1